MDNLHFLPPIQAKEEDQSRRSGPVWRFWISLRFSHPGESSIGRLPLQPAVLLSLILMTKFHGRGSCAPTTSTDLKRTICACCLLWLSGAACQRPPHTSIFPNPPYR